MAEVLLEHAQGGACIADMGYDADRIVAAIQARGMKAVIPSTASRKNPRAYDEDLYRVRYRVECFFHFIKKFRRIATRYEKTARNYQSFVLLASTTAWLT
jgi:transposase